MYINNYKHNKHLYTYKQPDTRKSSLVQQNNQQQTQNQHPIMIRACLQIHPYVSSVGLNHCPMIVVLPTISVGSGIAIIVIVIVIITIIIIIIVLPTTFEQIHINF